MTPPGTSPGPGPTAAPPSRPALVDTVAALFVFGGLFGGSQLFGGSFVVTGSLPARGPILGVAAILYLGSVVLGVLVRSGRYWLASVNLAGLFVIGYLPAARQPLDLLFLVAYLGAFLVLIRERRWFAAMQAWRTAAAGTADPAPGPTTPRTGPPRSGAPRTGPQAPAGRRRRPSGRR